MAPTIFFFKSLWVYILTLQIFKMNGGKVEANVLPRDECELDDDISPRSYVMSEAIKSGQEDEDSEDEYVNCFGDINIRFGIDYFNFNMQTSEDVGTSFYISSRRQPEALEIKGPDFDMNGVEFKPERKTVIIIHGFQSFGNASWIRKMGYAFLNWGDLNVIAVNWGKGAKTWKYWRAVSNTRQVGSEITDFLKYLMETKGLKPKDIHIVGHSLGAHIASYVSSNIGKVARITGLDPAQPCFTTDHLEERLDSSDADFVDVIHTNGRRISNFGLGMSKPLGHADFYPNGGMKQPGCYEEKLPFYAKLLLYAGKIYRAICYHSTSYLYFMESLTTWNCTFKAHRWDTSPKGLDGSMTSECDQEGACAEMGINAVGRPGGLPRASGTYFLVTAKEPPYCISDSKWELPNKELLKDFKDGFNLAN